MRKKVLTAISIILLIAVFTCGLTGCGEKQGIKSLIGKFENACNNTDIDAMLDCINPQIADPIKTGIGIYNSIFNGGDDNSAALGSIEEQIIGDKSEGGESSDFFESIEIEIGEITVTEDKASVSATLNFTALGKSYSKPVTISCIQEGDVWYISGFSFK